MAKQSADCLAIFYGVYQAGYMRLYRVANSAMAAISGVSLPLLADSLAAFLAARLKGVYWQ